MVERPKIKAGTPVGFLYWLGFMLALALLGYPPIVSIGFGAIAGVAGGTITALLKADEVDSAADTDQADDDLEAPATPPPKKHFRRYRERRSSGHFRRVRSFGNFFRRQS